MADHFVADTTLKVVGLSIVVPAYNEEALLESFLETLLATARTGAKWLRSSW
jgi:hypothetical protein